MSYLKSSVSLNYLVINGVKQDLEAEICSFCIILCTDIERPDDYSSALRFRMAGVTSVRVGMKVYPVMAPCAEFVRGMYLNQSSVSSLLWSCLRYDPLTALCSC